MSKTTTHCLSSVCLESQVFVSFSRLPISFSAAHGEHSCPNRPPEYDVEANEATIWMGDKCLLKDKAASQPRLWTVSRRSFKKGLTEDRNQVRTWTSRIREKEEENVLEEPP